MCSFMYTLVFEYMGMYKKQSHPTREAVYASSVKVGGVELPVVTGAQMIESQALDDGHGAIRFSVCLLDLGLALIQSSFAIFHSSPTLWGCLLCAFVDWNYVTCFLKL